MTNYPCSNIKLLLEHQEDLFYDSWEELEKIGQLFQVAIHSHPGQTQPKITNTSFCILVEYLFTKLDHYFKGSINTNMIFGFSE